ncbi:hypothetical protein V6N11_077912 [Hibiscus sabdariffa]|uniref:Uncharacterized protein n=1 Tax=Hibiscus sabdariffa TaxID=183260 RepID=A0ABR2TFF3_9ROSI
MANDMKLQQPLQESSDFDIPDIAIEDYFLAPMVSPARPNLWQEPAPPVSLERPGLWQERVPPLSLERPGLWQERVPPLSLERPGLWQDPAPPVSLERPGLWQEPAPPVSLERPGLWQEPTPPVCPERPGFWREQQWKDILSKEGLIQRCPRCKEIGHGLHHCPYPVLVFSTRESPENAEPRKTEIQMILHSNCPRSSLRMQQVHYIQTSYRFKRGMLKNGVSNEGCQEEPK